MGINLFNEQEEKFICTDYINGMLIKEIENKYNCSEPTIYNTLRKYGIKSDRHNERAFVDKKYYDDICDMYKDGQSSVKIGRKFHCSDNQIRRILRSNKITIRSIRTYSLDELSFSVFTNESLYWVGFINADGFIPKDPHNCRMAITLSRKDNDHLEKFCRFLKTDMPVRKHEVYDKRYDKKYYKSNVKITSKKIVDDLRNNFHIIERKTGREKWTDVNSELSKSQIRGIFDGDGDWYITKSNQIRFRITGGKDLLISIRDVLIKELGIKHVELNKDTGCYRLSYAGNIQAIKIGEWIYSNSTPETRMCRKYDRFMKHKEFVQNTKIITNKNIDDNRINNPAFKFNYK